MTTTIFEFLHPYFELLGFLSFLLFFISLAIIPWIIHRLPHDYFTAASIANKSTLEKNGFPTIPGVVVKNITGALFLCAGFVMLFIPGQGILSMVLGVSLMTFPGKKKIMPKILGNLTVRRSLNWVRKKTHQQLFIWENSDNN